MVKNILSIAGTDPTGGAGIQADIKAISAMGGYAMAAITAVVAQNTRGVLSFMPLDSSLVADQIDAVFEDVQVDAVKIGMVANASIAETIVDRLRCHGARNIVLDPVMVAKSGDPLLDPDAVAALRDCLVPAATVITPNLPEAVVLLNDEYPRSLEAMRTQAAALLELGCQWVLLKGGHASESLNSTDVLLGPSTMIDLTAPRINTPNDHGTGCTLSAALAALLPAGTVESSAREAKNYVHCALSRSNELNVGHGHGPLHHFHGFFTETTQRQQ